MNLGQKLAVALVGILGVLGVLGLMIVYFTFSWGFLFYKWWAWFVLPVFPALPVITYWQAVGLMMFTGVFKNKSYNRKLRENLYKEADYSTWIGMILPWLMLVISYFIFSIIY